MEYNIETTKILFNYEGHLAFCSPTGELPVEVVAVRDLPPETRYWIVDFETIENMTASLPPDDFFDAYELDEDVLGPSHGIALGYEEWLKKQSPKISGL